MSILSYRFNKVETRSGTTLHAAAAYTVTAYAAGAQVVSVAGATITVRAGHGFANGQKCIVGTDSTKYAVISNVTATSVDTTPALVVVAGDYLVNLGADTGPTSPSFDGSSATIYSDMDGTTAISQSALTTNSDGEYGYWHKQGEIWELVRSGSTPLQVLPFVTGTAALVIEAHELATGGAGTSGSPWTGWDVFVESVSNRTFHFSPGYYKLTSTLTLKAGTTLRGDGNQSRIIFDQTGTPNAGITNDTNAGDIMICDLYIDHDGDTAASTTSCINFSTGTGQNYFVSNVHIYDAGKDGITFVGGVGTVTNLKIVDCTFDTTDRHAIDLQANVSSVVIRGNRIRNTNTVTIGASIYAGSDASATDITVSGNVIENSSDNGIRTIGTDVAITGNHIRSCTTDGIRLAGSRITCCGNDIRSISEQGIKSENGSDHTIVGNVVTGCTQDGIQVRYTTSQASRISITGNTSTGNTMNGIRVYGGQDIVISGNYVGANTLNGIKLEGPNVGGSQITTRVLVQGNRCYGNGAAADNIVVTTSGAPAGTVDYFSIIGNVCDGNGTTNGGIDILTAPTTQGVVIDNVCFGNTTSDLSIPAGNLVYIRHTDFRSPFAAPSMAAMNGSMWFATTGVANQAAYIRENTAWIEVGAM